MLEVEILHSDKRSGKHRVISEVSVVSVVSVVVVIGQGDILDGWIEQEA